MRSKLYGILLVAVVFMGQSVWAELAVTRLRELSVTANTGEKPQSKIWKHDGRWWSVLQTSAGVGVFELQTNQPDAGEWRNVCLLINSTDVDYNPDYQADILADGESTFILLHKLNADEILIYRINYSGGAYTSVDDFRPASNPIVLSEDAETATLALDDAGSLWIAYDQANSKNICVQKSGSSYDSWTNTPVLISETLSSDDICAIVNLSNTNNNEQLGVMWSNQTTDEFGFACYDGVQWINDSPSYFISNLSDDHINLAVDSDGTMYAAVKTSIGNEDPIIALLIRDHETGWQDIYAVASDSGTRPIVLLNEEESYLTVMYTENNGGGEILYTQSPMYSNTTDIDFGPTRTLIQGDVNNISSTKQNWNEQFVAIASTSSLVKSIIAETLYKDYNDLVARWAMDSITNGSEIANTAQYEHNGMEYSDNHLQLVGDAHIITDSIRGNVLSLDGSGDWGRTDADPFKTSSLSVSDTITLSSWVKPEKKDTQRIVRKVGSSEVSEGYSLFLSSKGYYSVRFNDRNTRRVNSSFKYSENLNTWHHVAATYDGEAIRLYVNGILEGEKYIKIVIKDNVEELQVGAMKDGRYGFQGCIDDVRIYNRAFSANEIQLLYQNEM
jgi:hypothetical protein